jgi:hypothetical protein
MIIITGSGRSGTRTLAEVLGGHHEFRAQYILDKYFPKAVCMADPFDTIERRLSVVLDLFQGIDEETFIDSSNLHIHFIDAIHILFPAARFIFAVRNGKDFVRSAHSRQWHEHATFGTMPLPGDSFHALWKDMSPLQRNAWIWTYRNSRALDGLRPVPEDLKLTVKIEEVAEEETRQRIESFTGRRIDAVCAGRRWNANQSFDLPPKEEWTAEMDREFDEVAGRMMRLLDYD